MMKFLSIKNKPLPIRAMRKVIPRVTIAIAILFLTVTSVSAFPRTITKELTLPADGSDVTLTIKAISSSVIIYEIWTDNTPTDTAGLCDNKGGFPVTCDQSDYEVKSVTIMGSDYRPGSMPREIADEDKLAIRMLLDQEMSVDTAWPLPRNKTIKIVFGTNNGANDVKIRVIVGLSGGFAHASVKK